MKIVVAGGTGLIGQELVKHFSKQKHELIILARSSKKPKYNEKYIKWDGKTIGSWVNNLKNTDVLINLAGKSVDCRYTDKNKAEILNSRVQSVRVLEQAFNAINESPEYWINSSTATIYRHETETPNDENSNNIGEGFSVEVGKAWEQAVDSIKLNTKKFKLRIAIVLGNSGGAFIPYKKMAQFGAGGKHGDGKQLFSWIHIDDLCNIFDHILDDNITDEIINCAAPEPITNKVFMARLRKKVGIPFGIPAPKFLLKIGAFLLGTETELLLKSRWVISKKLPKSGFEFKYPTIDKALHQLLK